MSSASARPRVGHPADQIDAYGYPVLNCTAIPAPIPLAEGLCITNIEVYKFKFTWIIKNFSVCEAEPGQKLESCIFTAGPHGESQWRLQLFPRGRHYQSEPVSLNLILFECNKDKVQAKLKFAILNVKRERTLTVLRSTGLIERGQPVACAAEIGYDALMEVDSGFVPEGKLTIVCEGTVITDVVNTSGHSRQLQEEVPQPQGSLLQDLGSLLQSGDFGDVTLAVGAKEVLVHKAILAARSPVFAAMFKHRMEESKQNRVVITDIEYEVLQKMLTYIYTGTVQDIEEVAGDLLAAADKYDIDGLKAKCEEVLCATLTVENAEDLLVFADTYRAKRLKARCIYWMHLFSPLP